SAPGVHLSDELGGAPVGQSGRASRRNPTIARREQSAQGRTGQAEDLAQHQSEHRAIFRKRTSCVQTAPQNQQACSDQDRPGRGSEGGEGTPACRCSGKAAMRMSSCRTLNFVPRTSSFAKKNTTHPAKNGRI